MCVMAMLVTSLCFRLACTSSAVIHPGILQLLVDQVRPKGCGKPPEMREGLFLRNLNVIATGAS